MELRGGVGRGEPADVGEVGQVAVDAYAVALAGDPFDAFLARALGLGRAQRLAAIFDHRGHLGSGAGGSVARAVLGWVDMGSVSAAAGARCAGSPRVRLRGPGALAADN